MRCSTLAHTVLFSDVTKLLDNVNCKIYPYQHIFQKYNRKGSELSESIFLTIVLAMLQPEIKSL